MPRVTSRLFLGIDPGKLGGACLLHEYGQLALVETPVICFKDYSEHDLVDWVIKILASTDECQITGAIEKVNAMPGQGVVSMFTFGKGYGFLRGLLAAFKIPFIEPMARQWQPKLGIQPKGKKSSVEHKKILRAKAQRLWPKESSKITLGTADAMLIAEYCRLVSR